MFLYINKKMSKNRTFTILDARHTDGCPTKFSSKGNSGRFGRNPSSAASKAASGLCRVKRIKGRCSLYVAVRETTQGSKKKVFRYKVTRSKRKVPVELKGRTIEYENKTKSVSSFPGCGHSHKSSGRKISRSRKSKKNSTKKSSKKSSKSSKRSKKSRK